MDGARAKRGWDAMLDFEKEIFSTASCSSSRNSLNGIHSITHHPVHILVAVLPPALMVFFDLQNSNGSYESCLLLSDGFFCVKPSVESPPRYISIFSGNCSIILNLISIFISIYQ